MDFMYGLDNARYADFKADIVNDIAKEVMTQPKDLNTMYVLASRCVIVCSNQPNIGGATFATLEEGW